jgi:HK97 family phage major capsid protein
VTLLEQVLQRRAEAQEALDAMLAKVADEKRDLSTDEDTEFAAAVESIKTLDSRATELRDVEIRNTAAATAAAAYTPVATVTDQPEIYRQGGEVSYFRDIARFKIKGDTAAADRLTRNAQRTQSEMQKRTGVTTVAGAGGEFDPPLWMIDQYVPALRPGRPTADVLNKQPLPKGVSSVNVPKIATGSAVAAQSTQNTALQNTNPTTTPVASPVNTLAGFITVSQQELDQSPINMDQVWLEDLLASYDQQLDVAVIAALTGASGINAVTYTDASPTTAKINSQVGLAIADVHSARFAPPNFIVMHPNRWGKFNNYLDSQGRPLVVPNPNYLNAFGTGQVASQGVAGTLQGVPVLVDASVPQNLGAGTNQDQIIVFKSNDSLLYEGTPQADAMPQTFGNTLSVLLRFYNYYALGIRLAPGISVINGTGLVTTLAFGS